MQFKNNTSSLGSLLTATGSGATRTATYTVASSDEVAAGNLKYDVTNESSLEDVAGNALSGTISEATVSGTTIDNTKPTVTSGSVGYYGTYSGGSFSNAISDPVKGGVDVYTKVVFSEDMAEVEADDGTARPVIRYTIDNGTVAYDADMTFSLDSANAHAVGITRTANAYYVVDRTDAKVYAYHLDGTRNSAKDFASGCTLNDGGTGYHAHERRVLCR